MAYVLTLGQGRAGATQCIAPVARAPFRRSIIEGNVGASIDNVVLLGNKNLKLKCRSFATGTDIRSGQIR